MSQSHYEIPKPIMEPAKAELKPVSQLFFANCDAKSEISSQLSDYSAYSDSCSE